MMLEYFKYFINFICFTNATFLKDRVAFTVISPEGNGKWPLTIGILEDVVLTISLV